MPRSWVFPWLQPWTDLPWSDLLGKGGHAAQASEAPPTPTWRPPKPDMVFSRLDPGSLLPSPARPTALGPLPAPGPQQGAGVRLQALIVQAVCPQPVSEPVLLKAQGSLREGCQLKSLSLFLLLSPWPSHETPSLSSPSVSTPIPWQSPDEASSLSPRKAQLSGCGCQLPRPHPGPPCGFFAGRVSSVARRM